MSEPLILTLVLDDGSQQRFDALRRQHFPSARLVVGAHVTLFHALPASCEDRLRDLIDDLVAQPAFPVEVLAPRHLGSGVAYDLASETAQALRAAVRQAFAADLTRQDAQPWRPHVTVQNKVSAQASKALHAELVASFVPWTATATGVALWRYVGGPWEPVTDWAFSRQA